MLKYIKVERITEFLKKLEKRKFYGKIGLAYEAGKIVYLKKEETIKDNLEREVGTKEDAVREQEIV